jgi:uncharacterized protein (DUF433 family)
VLRSPSSWCADLLAFSDPRNQPITIPVEQQIFYGGSDPRELPRYTRIEAERATGVPATTIASWVCGYGYERKHDRALFTPVIRTPDRSGRLSFNNLIEVHVLRSLRVKHDVRLDRVRKALAVAESEFGVERLLISDQLRFEAGMLFLDCYGTISELTRSQQLAIEGMFEANLKRIDFGEGGLPRDFYPIERVTESGRKLILLSPLVSFGRAIVKRIGVSTRAIADRLNAGESVEAVVDDYGLAPDELGEATAYESVA